MANRITTLVEFVTDRAQSAAQKFRADLAAADGTVAKFKAGWSTMLASVAASPAILAAAAGAIAVAGKKVVDSFQDAALEVGKFSDATGLAAEDASRLLEVASDVGVGAGTIESAVARMNQAIGTGGGVVDELGLSLKRTADGAADVNATFLDTIARINAIEDPTKRAAAQAKIFGRGYKEAAEIIGLSADELKAKLEGVADAQVFGDDQVAKARELREEMDDVNDSAERISRAFGETLVPILADAAATVNNLIDSYDRLKAKAPEGTGLAGRIVTGLTGPFQAAGVALDELNQASARLDQALGAPAPGVQAITDAVRGAIDPTREHGEAVEDLGQRWSAAQIPLKAATGAFAEMTGAAYDNVSALEANAAAVEEAAEARADLNAETQRSIDHLGDYRRSQLDVADAQDRLNDAEAERTKLLTEGKVSAEDKARADDDVRRATDDLADAQADLNRVVASSIPTDEQKADSLEKVEDAQRSLEDAIRGVDDAQRSVEERERRLAKLRGELAKLNGPQFTDETKQSAAFKQAQKQADLDEKRADLTVDIADAERDLEDAHRDVSDAYRDVDDATRNLTTAQDENTRLLRDGINVDDQKRAALDRVADADARLRQAVADRTQVMADSIPTHAEVEQATRDVERAQMDLVTAIGNQAGAFAAQKGAVDDTTASLALQRQEIENIIALQPTLAAALQPTLDLLNRAAPAQFSQLPVTAREGSGASLVVQPGGIVINAGAGTDSARLGQVVNDALTRFVRNGGRTTFS